MTKHLINEAGGVKTYVAVTELQNSAHQGWRHVKVTTTYDYGRDPNFEQTKLDLFLNADDFFKFKSIVNSL